MKNLAASVRQRLATLARVQREDFQELLSRYARERLLYRLGVSGYKNDFILKGALLFSYWTGAPHRPTRDMDLLGHLPPDIELMERVIRDLCETEVEPDGLVFQSDSVHGRRIRDEEEYEGVRLTVTALLERARIPLQIDIGFGDRVVPAPEEINFPTILEFPSPRLKSYTRESVIAEKFEAMVKLGIVNSRMKDFYDVWTLSQGFAFEGVILSAAIKSTFTTRGTSIPVDAPLALTSEFYEDQQKKRQWSGFLSKGRLDREGKPLAEIVSSIREFLMPVSTALAEGKEFNMKWRPAGPWD